jgi:aminoglycoside phosphotransferase (APT) family kinase protein
VNVEQAAELARLTVGGEVIQSGLLPGGTHRRLFAVDLALPGGLRRVVVRDFGADAAAASFEAAVLRWLARVGLPAPRLLCQHDGALVITRLPGRPSLAPADLAAWTQGLAAALAQLHRAPLDGADFLPDQRASLTQTLAHGPPEQDQVHPDCSRLWTALRRRYARLTPVAPTLVHGDYFAGNVLWWRRQVSGVVDWDDAGLAQPGTDVGNCRAELAIYPGGQVPSLFLQAYERGMGPLADRPFWDLLGAQRLFPGPERYLQPLRSLGAQAITADLLATRLRQFIAAALASEPG